MGKLIHSLNGSLDGFVETPDHDVDYVDDDVHSLPLRPVETRSFASGAELRSSVPA